MTKVEEMWATLLAYLPQAIANRHGDSWAKMCSEKTTDAAYDAYRAAYSAGDAPAAYATGEAYDACRAAYFAGDVTLWAQVAITAIKEALAQPEQELDWMKMDNEDEQMLADRDMGDN